MHKDLIHKFSLVSSSGLNYAEYPDSGDSTKAQLSGGIMSAIMTFSKEVHDRDIEYMSYYDRSLIFVQISDLIVVVEVSSTMDPSLIDQFVADFKSHAKPMFDGKSSDNITVDDAYNLLEDIYHSDWLHESLNQMGFQQSLHGADKFVIEVNHRRNGDYRVTNGSDDEYLGEIAQMIHNNVYSEKVDGAFSTGFIQIPQIERSLFIISRNKTILSKVGILSVESDLSTTLFRMTPLLSRSALIKLHDEKSYPLDELLSDLSTTHDIRPNENLLGDETLKSLQELENFIDNVDQAIFAVVSGEPVMVIGEREDVQTTIDLLLIFNQHLISKVFWYSDTNELIDHDIIGISPEELDNLDENKIVHNEMVYVNVDNKTVEGRSAQSNEFLRNLYSRIKTLPINQAAEMVYRELELIVSYAISATYYALFSKQKALQKLNTLKQSITDNSQYEIIQLLATKQNDWLDALIRDETFDMNWI